ncbi:uncharacterized protein LOC110990546 isoform X2 [Acanthaster planci]|uniref:Uncharacterized protein LOC110990546 isoform X2 n=1 Tax=Acanthaster planci TaxID=133434 RepID=A0A8B8A2V2_ACAPL|nr:uncharacterized protein LOC110990546 isoform X2 [Acanthaster planci]
MEVLHPNCPDMGHGDRCSVVASIITLLEVIFFFEPCFEKCCSPDNCCGKTWTVVSWLDNWKRSAIYIALSVICFLDHKNVWAIVAGVVLDLLAILYLLRTYQEQALRHAASELTPQPAPAPSTTKYTRFDERQSTKRETDTPAPVSQEPESDDDYFKTESKNPFGDFDDDDADPEGDAGISRYP